jgi:hypothetical protein
MVSLLLMIHVHVLLTARLSVFIGVVTCTVRILDITHVVTIALSCTTTSIGWIVESEGCSLSGCYVNCITHNYYTQITCPPTCTVLCWVCSLYWPDFWLWAIWTAMELPCLFLASIQWLHKFIYRCTFIKRWIFFIFIHDIVGLATYKLWSTIQ